MRPRQMVWTQTTWLIRAKRTQNGLMLIPVQLFDESAYFLVDTGAAYSIIDRKIADDYELPLLQAVQ